MAAQKVWLKFLGQNVGDLLGMHIFTQNIRQAVEIGDLHQQGEFDLISLQ